MPGLVQPAPVGEAKVTKETVEIVCSDTETVFKTIKEKFGERVEFGGTLEDGSIVLYWINRQDKTWTMTMTKKDKTCIVLTGYGFIDRSFTRTLR
jgi:hypothetical protein